MAVRISKEKLDALKKRGRRAGRALASGTKGTAYEGAAGVIAAYAGQLLDKNIGYATNRPWVKGAGLVLAGHMLKRKASLSNVGAALCGAGGYALGLHLQQKQAAAKATTSQPAAAPAPTAETSGVYPFPTSYPQDTGIVFSSAARAA